MRLCSVLALIAGLAGSAQAQVTQHSSYDIPKLNARLGGLSGIEVGANGQQFWIVNDDGSLFQGQFARDENGAIVGVTGLLRSDIPLPDDLRPRLKIDSEGIAVDSNGRVIISFELNHAVVSFGKKITALGPLPDSIQSLGANRGLEALAISNTGAVVAIPESGIHGPNYTPIYAFSQAGWVVIAKLPMRQGFRVTGADFAPNGDLFILERRTGALGFQSLVRRVDLKTGLAQTVLHTGWGTHSNMEGIAMWQAAPDDLRMILIADNNFLPILPNELVEYSIAE